MGMYLIAATLFGDTLPLIISVVEVAIALGLVIFVHELGHFAVAKMCGVKCEKFYLGFDIYGLKLAKFTYGETEYGIGVLPLGGYVKMLGQEDNPARVAEELERAKMAHQPGAHLPDDPAAAEREAAEEAEREHHLADVGVQGFDASGQPIYNPRSYMAKSVPQRMAIISAGVVMNVIFAFIVATIAYWLGVLGPDYAPVVVGGTSPGSPAWQASLQPDDKVIQIGEVKDPQFRELRNAVTLGDIQAGVDTTVIRAETGTTETINIIPDSRGPFAMIGLSGPRTLEVYLPEREGEFDGVEIQSEPPLEAGDLIVAIDGQPAETYGDLARAMALNPDKPLTIEVLRGKTKKKEGERITVEVAPRPMRTLGLAMEMGPIMTVQQESPAAMAGLKPGDRLVAIDGEPIADPIRLAEELRTRAGQSVSLTIKREGSDEAETIENVELRPTTEMASLSQLLNPLVIKGQPVVVPALGIAYRVLNRVEAVDADGPAAGKVSPGQVILGARLIPPKDAKPKGIFKELELEFTDKEEQANFPALLGALQDYPADTTVEITLSVGTEDSEPQVVSIESQVAQDWFNPDRVLITQPMDGELKATSLAQAMELGAQETKEALLMVFSFLRKQFEGQISPRMLGGPVTIFKVAKQSADDGLSDLLIFVAMLSANLAVINFLPIPVLDGGHMVFLALEGIRGKPVGEKVLVGFQTAGFLFIVSLMAFVLALDFGLISRFN